MATIKDIARIANVSPSTVSFVLNGKAREMKVSPATEQRILEIVAATGYRPSNVARRLRASEAERPLPGSIWFLRGLPPRRRSADIFIKRNRRA